MENGPYLDTDARCAAQTMGGRYSLVTPLERAMIVATLREDIIMLTRARKVSNNSRQLVLKRNFSSRIASTEVLTHATVVPIRPSRIYCSKSTNHILRYDRTTPN